MVATRAWRHEGFIYLLAVNCTQKRQTATLSLSGMVELVASEFGLKPKVDADVFGIPGLGRLPAIRWKRHNLETLRKEDVSKFIENAKALERTLE